jgi:hypothetical protein
VRDISGFDGKELGKLCEAVRQKITLDDIETFDTSLVESIVRECVLEKNV